MIYVYAAVAGLLSGAALGFCWGWLAAYLYTSIAGAQDGGPAMAGFFYVAPFGFVTGFLLTVGWVLKSNTALWSGGIVFVIGLFVFLMPWMSSMTPQAAYILSLEFAPPQGADPERCKWGYQGHNAVGKAEWPLSQSPEGILGSEIEMSDSPEKRFVYFAVDADERKFEVPVSGVVTAKTEWTPWLESKGVRFRWRIRER